MAVCGRCLLCGHKFNGDETPDVAVRWTCTSEHEACSKPMWHGEARTHAICTSCHNALVDGTLEGAVADLVALLARRSD